jgi:hypothetical protein
MSDLFVEMPSSRMDRDARGWGYVDVRRMPFSVEYGKFQWWVSISAPDVEGHHIYHRQRTLYDLGNGITRSHLLPIARFRATPFLVKIGLSNGLNLVFPIYPSRTAVCEPANAVAAGTDASARYSKHVGLRP